MPTYPTGTYAPASKSNGQTITAAMFNDPDAEIVAVENALLNGLAHAVVISTGGLTVSTGPVIIGQSLSVAGTSTFAGIPVMSTGLTVSTGPTVIGGSLQVNGDSTFSGAVTFSSAVTFTLPLNVPRVRCGIAANQNLASAQWTGINWVTEDYNSHSMHSTSANSSRITFTASSGVYHIGASANPTNASSGAFLIRLLLGDSTANTVAAQGFVAPTALNMPLAVSGDVRIADTATYVTVQVYNGGASTNSVTSTGLYVTAVWAHRIG